MNLYALLARELLPAVEDDLGVRRHLLHEETATADGVGGDERRSAPAEWLYNNVTTLG